MKIVMGRKPNVVVLAKEMGEFELLNISGELVQEVKCESQRKIKTHGGSSHAEQYEPVNISGESVKESKRKTETKFETHAEQYEPVKAKPISTKVFYKGKQLSKGKLIVWQVRWLKKKINQNWVNKLVIQM